MVVAMTLLCNKGKLDSCLVKLIHEMKGGDERLVLLWKGTNECHAVQLIVKLGESEIFVTKFLDMVDGFVNAIHERLQGLALLLLDGEEVVIGIKTGTRTLLDKHVLQSLPHLDRIILNSIKVNALLFLNREG
ncbi:hypothetical protein NLJ89_g12427 [Agrocybe chaxingu]|uniref:Uncharacterized protein n=1 Tax=Agrocybe chaxingu TaxID=84603 RepID=A0A9W8JMI7_9AGAR|nr:hypothetical protein NLJ89_g12427 [Agrocybe chaxingu]